MGGDYNYTPSVPREPIWGKKIKAALETKDRKTLIDAYKTFSTTFDSAKGFIGHVAKFLNIPDMARVPREFSELEYEVKFNIDLQSSSQENGKNIVPSMVDYLNIFDFPATTGTRFLKDPLNKTSEGFNHYFGTADEEQLVVIEKMGKGYLKEKGEFIPILTQVRYKNLISKRKETLHVASLDQIINKIGLVVSNPNVKYRGKLRKERGDFFVLDVHDGRIYNLTISLAHLISSQQQDTVSGVQRQLEIEYAGYLPDFTAFQKDSEKQLLEGIAALAQYTYALYGVTVLENDWHMRLVPTKERKYDFVANTLARAIQNNEGLRVTLETFNSQVLPAPSTDITLEEANQGLVQ